MDLYPRCVTMGRMLRRLVLVVFGIALVSGSASAQVFKPRGKTAAAGKSSDKKPDKGAAADPGSDKADTAAAKKPAAKKASRSASSTRKATKPSRKSLAAKDKGRPDDLTPEPAAKNVDPDYVVITDDED